MHLHRRFILTKRLNSSIRRNSACMLRSECLTTCFIPGTATSIFTEGAGIMARTTTARGYLLPGVYSRPYYSAIESARYGISVIWSSDDSSMTGRITKGESTAPNFVAGIGEWNTDKGIGTTAGERNTQRGNRSGCPRFCFSAVGAGFSACHGI